MRLPLFIFVVLLSCTQVFCVQYEILPYNPVAMESATVIRGNARFTVLTENLFRLEYASNGKFEDRATVAVVNRNLNVPPFTTSTSGNFLSIKTAALELRYELGQPFSQTTLTINAVDSTLGFNSWYYGQPNPGNLLGTIKSLDELNVISLNCDINKNVIVHEEDLHCEWGLISRDGWVVVNDTTNWGLTNTFWWDSPNRDLVDLYFFGHGHNYKQAIKDYTLIGGKIAMVPRYVFGILWSRWFNLNNVDVTAIVADYETRYLPLDVFILDMDWHIKNAWGGYSFDKKLFPYPENIVGWLKNKGLAMAANLHDDDGVHPYEEKYVQMCNAMGLDPNSGNPIPFSSVNATYLFSLEDVILNDLEDKGFDFWWIDWQQGGTAGGSQGLKQNPTYILDHVRSTDHLRRDENVRGLVLARWGGLGTHRYQVGFSGDVASLTWANLAFQPYFSWTSSNVGYGFWSHDLVGPAQDHELHTRWIQWGAYSGIFRTHDRGMAVGGCSDTINGCPKIEVWNVPTPYFEANRLAMLERETLIPYIYNAARQAFDTGISLLRPMYYEFPELDLAYKGDSAGNFGQYFFGDDIIVAPITSAGLSNTTMAVATIWIPPGSWVEKDTGVILKGDPKGNTLLTKYFDLSETPVFVRAGAIIPKIPVVVGDTIGLARRQYTTLVLQIYPGAPSGSTTLYEDDGISVDYLSLKYTTTTIKYTRTPTNLQLTISAPDGQGYSSFPTSRNYVIEIINSLPVNSATINGVAVPYSRNGELNCWQYDGEKVTTIIKTGVLSTASPVTVSVTTDAIDDSLLSGFKGAIQKSILAKRNLDAAWSTPGSTVVQPGNLELVAASGFELSYLAGVDKASFTQKLKGLPALFAAAVAEIENLRPAPAGSLIQLWNADRQDNCLCGSPDCQASNQDYQELRIEGYQPKPGTPGSVNLNDFWDDAISDNYASTQSSVPAGYVTADFDDGIVFTTFQPGTVPLQLFWSESRKDMLTVASPAGIAYAQQNNYKQLNATLGYVYSSPPSDYYQDVLSVAYPRWAYSLELLYNALN